MPVVSAYQCDDCGNLYLSQDEMNFCIKTHKKSKERKAKEKAKKEAQLEFANYARLNATSWKHLEAILVEQIRIFDPKATLEILISGIQMVSATHSKPIDGVSYTYHPKTKEAEENNKKAIYVAAKGTIRGKFFLSKGKGLLPIDFSSWVRENVLGINTGTGSGRIEGGFSYELTLYLQDFPHILNSFNQFKELEQEHYIHIQKKKELNDEYQEYHRFKCYSDPTHAAYTMELKELEAKVKEIKDLITARSFELDDERATRTNLPFHFDMEKYIQLKQEFSK